MDKLRIAAAGCGAIGRVHAYALKEIKEAQICALYNRHLDKALALKEELGLDVPCFNDYGELLKKSGAQAVTICTAPDQHLDMTLKALDAGLHVIVEKPMAKSVQECELMLAAAAHNKRLLSVICQNRFRNKNFKLKKLYEESVKSGLIGKIAGGRLESLWWRGQCYYDPAWRGTWQTEGGGCLMSHAVHQLDMLLWVLGMPNAVSAQMFNDHHLNSQCEDEVFAIFYYEDFRISFECSLNHHGESQGLYLQGEQAAIGSPFMPSAYQALPNGYPRDNPEALARLKKAYDGIPDLKAEGHQAQLENFVRAVLGKEPLLTPGKDGRDALMLIMGIYKAAVSGKKVTLPLTADDEFCAHETRVPLMPHFHEKTHSAETTASLAISL